MESPPPSPPERLVQVRNDLDALYELVGDVQTTVRGIASTQQNHGVRLGRLERDVAALRTGQAELRSDMAELRAGQAELRAGQAELRSDVAEIRTDVAGLRTGQDEILRLLRARP